jgi:hypothetical protein
MLVAVLNCCTKEELEEEEDEPLASLTDTSVDNTDEAVAARRKAIKNKIMAVGRMARVFALLREESERVSELKSVSGSTKLPYGTLALGAEGIKDAINTFDDACVRLILVVYPSTHARAAEDRTSRTSGCRRTSSTPSRRRARRCSLAPRRTRRRRCSRVACRLARSRRRAHSSTTYPTSRPRRSRLLRRARQ